LGVITSFHLALPIGFLHKYLFPRNIIIFKDILFFTLVSNELVVLQHATECFFNKLWKYRLMMCLFWLWSWKKLLCAIKKLLWMWVVRKLKAVWWIIGVHWEITLPKSIHVRWKPPIGFDFWLAFNFFTAKEGGKSPIKHT
jgi:hypothetical protein